MMKKLFSLALAAAAVFSASAQDAKTQYEQAKALDDAFNKEVAADNLTPETAKGLLDAMNIYQQVLVLDQQPDAKGKVKPKYTKKIQDSMAGHLMNDDFTRAAVVLFNGGMKYPEAYAAFMTSGELARQTNARPDSLYAVDFMNAGNSAYGTDFAAAAEAFKQARLANIKDPNCYMYEIDSRTRLAGDNAEAKAEIHAIAEEAVNRFGAGNDYIYGSFLQGFLDSEQYDKALERIDTDLRNTPDNSNLYRLRGIVHNAMHKYTEASEDFVKCGEITSNFNYAMDAVKNLNAIGKYILGQADAAVNKETILSLFNSAKNITERAKSLEGANLDDVNYQLEDIDYNINNANKL